MVLVETALEEDDADEGSEHAKDEVHAVEGRQLLRKDELGKHDENGKEDWEHSAQQIPGGELLEEQAHRQAQPADHVVRRGGLEVRKEEEHALDR